MADRIPFNQGQDKAAGVARVEAQFFQFMTAHSWELAPATASQADVTDVISQIWDLVPTLGAGLLSGITGPFTASDDEEILVFAVMIAAEMLSQYRQQLPGGGESGP